MQAPASPPCIANSIWQLPVAACVPFADTLQLVEKRNGDGAIFDASGTSAIAERNGATLRLKEGGGAFYAPGPLKCIAVHWPRLIAGAQSGQLHLLEAEAP